MPAEGKGEEEGKHGAGAAEKGCSREHEVCTACEQAQSGAGDDEQTEREEGTDSLQGGDEREDDERKGAVAQGARGQAEGGSADGIKEPEEERTAEESEKNEGDRGGAESDAEIGVAHAEDIAEEPIVHLLLQSQREKNEIAQGEGSGMNEGERRIGIYYGAASDEKRGKTYQQSRRQSPQ